METIPTSPYHLVAVRKPQGWEAVRVYWYLVDGGEVGVVEK